MESFNSLSSLPNKFEDQDLFSGILSIPGEKFGQWDEKHLIITQEYLHIKSIDKSDSTATKDECHKLEIFTTEFVKHEEIKGRYMANFINRQNGQHYEFSTKNKSIFSDFKHALIPFTIQKNFYKKFELGSKINSGAFGSVYETVNKKTSEKFAAKIYKTAESVHDHDFLLYSIKQEIDILKKVRGTTGLLYLCEYHVVGKEIILVTDQLKGGEINDFLKKGQLLKTLEACDIIRQSSVGLTKLAKLNIAHCDIKPTNIMLKYEGNSVMENEVVICDFGLGVNCSEDVIERDVGTPGFIAPELFENRNSKKQKQKMMNDPKCDVFSLGVVFYQLLTGKSLWKNTEANKILEENHDCKLDLSDKNPNLRQLDNEVRDLLRMMLNKDPSKRISAASVTEKLIEIEMKFTKGNKSVCVISLAPSMQNIDDCGSQKSIDFNQSHRNSRSGAKSNHSLKPSNKNLNMSSVSSAQSNSTDKISGIVIKPINMMHHLKPSKFKHDLQSHKQI